MTKSNLKSVENSKTETETSYRSGTIFVRKIGKNAKGFEGHQDWRVLPLPLVHEMLGVDAEVKWIEPSWRGEFPKREDVDQDVRTPAYPDYPKLDALQECVNQYCDRYQRTKQAIPQDKLVAGFVPSFTDAGLIPDGDALVAAVESSRKPITRSPSVKRSFISALRGFVEQVCKEKSLDLRVKTFVYICMDTAHVVDDRQRVQLDNWLAKFRESEVYKPEFDTVIDSCLAEVDQVRSLVEVMDDGDL